MQVLQNNKTTTKSKTSRKVMKIPKNMITVKQIYAPDMHVDISQHISSKKSKDIEWLQKIKNLDDIVS